MLEIFKVNLVLYENYFTRIKEIKEPVKI